MNVSPRSSLSWLRLPLLVLPLLTACGGPPEDISTDSMGSTEQQLVDLTGRWQVTGYTPAFRIDITQSGSMATAIKLDVAGNVPPGEVHWRANVDTGVGEGQIAGPNYTNPQFVAGTLEILSSTQIRFTFSTGGTFTYNAIP